MFSNLFNFQAKKDCKSKSEDGKKGKSKKSKDSSKSKDGKESEIVMQENESVKLTIKEDEEQFEEILPQDISSNNISIDGLISVGNNGGTTENLLIQLETVEGEARRLADGLEQVIYDRHDF